MTHKMHLLPSSVVMVLLCLPSIAFAKIAHPTLAGLVHGADVIVLARVGEVPSTQNRERIAKAQVLEVWKGAAGKEVSFRAFPTWACDTSTAIEGETVVLFLVGSRTSSIMSIAHAGRGRIPVKSVEGQDRVLLAMPVGRSVKSPAKASTQQSWIEWIGIDELRGKVALLMKQKLRGGSATVGVAA
jgi:hypothetical protein